jgi:uncharacterized protein YbjT (DUF2867 family)
MAEKTIAVLGATGAQGGGLARAILADPAGGYRVRAITRNPASDKAKALAAAGAEVVAADLDDVESLKKAFAGAYGVFGVTNFWEHFSPAKETQQGRNIAAAAKAAGVEHVIWSTFEDTREKYPLSDTRMPTLQERYKVPHFDAKAEAHPAFDAAKTTFLCTSFYWDNMIFFGMQPQRTADGAYAITLPMGDKKLPGMAAADIGPCAYGIFKRGGSLRGRTVGIAGEHLTGGQMAEKLSRGLGVEVRYNAVTPDAYRALGFPGADDLGNMFQYKAENEAAYCGLRDLKFSRELNPGLQTFDQWLAANAKRIPLEQPQAG